MLPNDSISGSLQLLQALSEMISGERDNLYLTTDRLGKGCHEKAAGTAIDH